MRFIGIDFETFWCQKTGYTLTKMTTEEYVRDDRFEVVCAAMYTLDHRQTLSTWGPRDTQSYLQRMNWDDIGAVMWNGHFDGAILAWRMGCRPRAYICAMAMWRMMGFGKFGGESLLAATTQAAKWGWPVRPKGDEVLRSSGLHARDFGIEHIRTYGKYCQDDAYNAAVLFEGMMAEGFPQTELACVAAVIRCFTEPRIQLNSDVLARSAQQEADELDRVLTKAAISLEECRSDAKFAKALERYGVAPPTKLNAKGVEKFAFAKSDWAFQELEQGVEGDEVAALCEARLRAKSTIVASRSERLLGISARGRWPVMLRPGGAHTLRLSGGGKDARDNAQNPPKRGLIRESIEAPAGYEMVVGDFSQIEPRMLAYVAGQWDMVEQFGRGEDTYSNFGNESGLFDVVVSKATADERFLCKGVILGGGFGAGPASMERQIRNLAYSLGLNVNLEQDYAAANAAYRRLYSNIPALWKNNGVALANLIAGQGSQFGTDGLVKFEINRIGPRFVLPNGLGIYYHNLRWEEVEDSMYGNEMFFDKVVGKSFARTRTHGPKVTENEIQALAGLLCREAWVRIGQRCRRELGIARTPIVLQSHDELVALVRTEKVKAYIEVLREEMSRAPAWAPGLPVAMEWGVGKNYAEAK